MRFPPSLAFSLCLLAPLPAFGGLDRSLQHARTAQLQLGTDTWSRVLRIENENRRSLYPRTLYVLVFELADILWLYSDLDGTQSLSVFRNHTKQDKNDLGPLLLGIDRGFGRWSDVTETARYVPESADLPRGCFIESVAAWRRIAAQDPTASAPMLLSFYADASAGIVGHTVLTFAVGDSIGVLDPIQPRVKDRYPRDARGDPLALARAIAGRSIAKARFLVLPELTRVPAPTRTVAAAGPAPANPT